MAVPFVPKLKLIQAANNEDVIFLDDSNYDTNTEGIDKNDVLVRQIKVTDSAGSVVIYSVMTAQDTDGNYIFYWLISKDMYYKMEPTFTFSAIQPRTSVDPVVTTGFYDTAFLNVMENNLGDCANCKKGGICSDIGWSAHALRAAIGFGSRELGLLAQKAIDAANSFINNVANC